MRHLYAFYYRDTPEILYWRDAATHKEVDIIIRSPLYTIPVEVKYRQGADLRATDGLVTFCKQEGLPYGYWVTQRERDFGLVRFPNVPTRFLKVPAHIFTYLLG